MGTPKRDSTYQELNVYINNYLRGMDGSTALSRKFAEYLQEIKQLYGTVLNYSYHPIDTVKEKQSVAIIIIGLILWRLLYYVFPDATGLRTIYIIALLASLYAVTKNNYWSTVPLLVYVVGMFFHLGSTITFILLTAFTVYTLINIVITVIENSELQKKRTNYQKARQRLPELQKKMTDMLPDIKQEMQEWHDKWYQGKSNKTGNMERVDFSDSESFPLLFWWQIPPEDVKKFEGLFSCEKYGDWQTKLVDRSTGKAFHAQDEYSPLFHPTLYGDVDQNARRFSGIKIFDIISRYVALSVNTRTINYQVPAHGSMDVLSKRMSTLALADSIDKSYAARNLEYGDYRMLAGEIFELGRSVEDYANATRTEQDIEYVPVHDHANIWTGQILLADWINADGQRLGYALLQYRCQFPHLIENLFTMGALPIRYIDYDYFSCNPYFLVRFYSLFPSCI